ncbi:MAG: hypothetical protein KAI79_18845 [Bacteroidales bacterium]|nr:hypothetical protein [Bacteroidales bacterium]
MLKSGCETNFNALLFGYKHGYDGCFYNLGSYGTYWSSTEYTKDSLYWTRTFTDIDQLLRGQTYKEYALPIRCVKD